MSDAAIAANNVVKIPRAKIVAWLDKEASATGITLREFYELGNDDLLDEPMLRDLWLIWGDVLNEADLGAVS